MSEGYRRTGVLVFVIQYGPYGGASLVFERRKNIFVDTDFGVLHEDEDILVLDKPAPLAVHPVGCYSELNIHSLLKKDPRWADCPIKMVHRLDAETSGVLVIAKHFEAASSLGKQFLSGRVQKWYEAVVFGRPPEDSGDLEYPLGFDKSSGFQSVRTHDPDSGERAHTRFTVLGANTQYARVRLEPKTGRTHQLRAHMAFLGHPIVGDKIYIDLNIFSRYVKEGLEPGMLERLKLPRLALHATEMRFDHPRSKCEVTFRAPLAKLLRHFIGEQGL